MTRERIYIDNLIEPAVTAVMRRTPRGSYFRKSEVLAQVIRHQEFGDVLKSLRDGWKGWGIDTVVLRYIDARIGAVLQQRDSFGIRRFECWAVNEPERRWMPFTALTANTLRVVMQQTRTQARKLTLKGEGYELFLAELERLGPNATVADVYDRVAPLVQAHRAAG